MELNLSLPQAPGEMTQLPVIKAEPPEVSQFLKVTPGKYVQETLSDPRQALPLSRPCLSLRTPTLLPDVLTSPVNENSLAIYAPSFSSSLSLPSLQLPSFYQRQSIC